jgi:PAS domain-containing protein
MPLSENLVERKRTEEALRNSVEGWRSIFESSAIGAALTDLNGCFVAANPGSFNWYSIWHAKRMRPDASSD